MPFKKIFIALLFAMLIAVFFVFDLGQYFTLDYIKSQQTAFNTYYEANAFLTIALFMTVYITVTALSLPGAAIMTLLAGALFGLTIGTILVSFASTIGATLAMIVSRFLLKDWVQEKFKDKLKLINEGIEKDGLFYLFTLRLVPIVPFFVINIVMGLMPIRFFSFYWVSQLGMFAGTIVYVFAGTQLGQIETLGDIVSPGLLAAFVLIGIFPLIARKSIQLIKGRQHHA